jgi:hypothetical protein
VAYLISTETNPTALAYRAAIDPQGPHFDRGAVETADRMEIWGSSFSDPGDDYTEFVLFAGDHEVARKRVAGY